MPNQKLNILDKTLAGHKDLITSVAFSPDRSYIASGPADQTVKIWQVVPEFPEEQQVGVEKQDEESEQPFKTLKIK